MHGFGLGEVAGAPMLGQECCEAAEPTTATLWCLAEEKDSIIPTDYIFFILHTKTVWTWNNWGRGLESGWTWNHWGWDVRVSKLPWTGARSIWGFDTLLLLAFQLFFLRNQGMNQKLSDSRPTTTDWATVVNTVYFYALFMCWILPVWLSWYLNKEIISYLLTEQ